MCRIVLKDCVGRYIVYDYQYHKKLFGETFEIRKDCIIHYDGYYKSKEYQKRREFPLPDNIMCVCCHAALHGDYTEWHLRMNRDTRMPFIIEDKFAITILRDVEEKEFFDSFFKWGPSFGEYYTAFELCARFAGDKKYIFDFFCTQQILDELLKDRKCTVIVPESLKDQVKINSPTAEVYIHKNW